jgi:hypothetical protein
MIIEGVMIRLRICVPSGPLGAERCGFVGEGGTPMGEGFFREERTGVLRTFTAAGGDGQPFL